jgi:hypothetical protein
MKEVDCFKYLGVDIDRDGRIKSEIRFRVSEGEKVNGVLKKIWKVYACQRMLREVCMKA